MRLYRLAPLALALAPLLAACGPAVRVDTPDGFATLADQTEYVYRATNADGVVIAVRKEVNKPTGNLAFWADIVDRKLRLRGYATDGAPSDVRTRSGHAGREMHYTADSNGRPYRFWTAVFVTESDIFIVEVAGDKDRFKAKLEGAIEKAIASIRIG